MCTCGDRRTESQNFSTTMGMKMELSRSCQAQQRPNPVLRRHQMLTPLQLVSPCETYLTHLTYIQNTTSIAGRARSIVPGILSTPTRHA